ncbi:hypothetical protein Celaphus_00012338 [Cervus elaphus hippelaphus]|uniref:Uncharacterized protein n=1 Tax=Cervus elaphus hippelaphus TaxID=46360 RepID=A0A212CL45_CEREH|nr:hypothetical protein Celaphus_00012338 [Cervus elaphus hippelaphus]
MSGKGQVQTEEQLSQRNTRDPGAESMHPKLSTLQPRPSRLQQHLSQEELMFLSQVTRNPARICRGFAESQLQAIPFLLGPRLLYSLNLIFAVCVCLSNRTGGCNSQPETKRLYYTHRKQDGP